ncbi:hypothetical protein [Burkholderia sp. LMG 21824]|uniref:hypothetical protein n=1 Tax=Burkholderia sp. LMG 21824 TaxID=3158172 RepID=UPI003C2EE83C
MLKAVAETTNGKMVILGLSRENITRLQAGKPIKFDAEQIGLPGYEFFIVFGETEQAIYDDLNALAVRGNVETEMKDKL